jgi:hypothetical protein
MAPSIPISDVTGVPAILPVRLLNASQPGLFFIVKLRRRVEFTSGLNEYALATVAFAAGVPEILTFVYAAMASRPRQSASVIS